MTLIHTQPNRSSKPRTWRFKLRTILLAVSLAVLIIPLGGVYVFRFYEGELVKQTEVELIAQAALIAAVYKREVETLLKLDGAVADYGGKVAATVDRMNTTGRSSRSWRYPAIASARGRRTPR